MRSLLGQFISEEQYILKFEDLDEKSIKNKLKIHSKAMENGKANLPKSDIENRDAVQSEIIQYFEHLRDLNVEKINENIKNWHHKATTLKLNFDFTKLERIPRTLDADYCGLKSSKLTGIESSLQELNACLREKENFKKENGLKRLAVYPESKAFWWATIITVLLFEVVLNSVFFAQGHTLGIIGGIVEACSISLINVAIGLSFGKFALPFKNHQNTWKKLLAYLGLITVITALFAFNLLSAHYREAFIMNPMEVNSALAIDGFLDNPIGFTDYKSWVLIFVGFFIVLISIYKGYKYDDPYPGYGKLDRREKEAAFIYNEKKGFVEDEIKELKDDALDQIDKLQSIIEAKAKTYSQTMLNNNHSIDAYIAFEKQLESHCNNLLAFYETTNIEFRSDSPPICFGKLVELVQDPIFWEKKRISVDDEIKDKYEKLGSTINRIEIEVIDQFKEALGAFEKIRI